MQQLTPEQLKKNLGDVFPNIIDKLNELDNKHGEGHDLFSFSHLIGMTDDELLGKVIDESSQVRLNQILELLSKDDSLFTYTSRDLGEEFKGKMAIEVRLDRSTVIKKILSHLNLGTVITIGISKVLESISASKSKTFDLNSNLEETLNENPKLKSAFMENLKREIDRNKEESNDE